MKGPLKVSIREVGSNDLHLASQLNDLYLRVYPKEKHPLFSVPAIVQLVDPKLGRSGVALAAFARGHAEPVGYYFLTRTEGNGLAALAVGVHPEWRGRDINKKLHAAAKRIAKRDGFTLKLSTVAPENIASLKPNLKEDGFSVVAWTPDKYGPGMHRFYVSGNFRAPSRYRSEQQLHQAPIVALERGAIRHANQAQKPYRVQIAPRPELEQATAYGYVDWKRFHGTHIHEEGGRHYLLLEPQRG